MQIQAKLSALALGALTVLSVAGATTIGAQQSRQANSDYKRDLPAALVREAKVSEADASKVALSRVPNGRIQAVELEREDGKLLYSYELKVPAKSGVEEVNVDAISGLVASVEHETPASERGEARKEQQEAAHARAAGSRPKRAVNATTASLANGDVVSAPSTGVPLAITQVGTFAEDGYDAVRTARWSAAAAFADSLGRSMGGLPASPAAGGVSASEVRATVATLNDALRRRDRVSGMRATNRITYLAAQLGAPYHAQTPTEVLLMDYYGRALEIDASTHDTVALRRTAGDISQAWRALRPGVVAHGGSAEATRFDALVARVRAAKTPAESGQLATPFLDAVDKLELVFAKA